MTDISETAAILEELVNHENTLRDFYWLLKNKHREHAYFWEELSNEEAKHAEMLKECSKGVYSGEVTIKDKFVSDERTLQFRIKQLKGEARISDAPLRADYVRFSFGLVERFSNRAKTEKQEMVEALENAEYLETKTVDLFAGASIQSSSPKFAGIIDRLREDSNKHREKIVVLKNALKEKEIQSVSLLSKILGIFSKSSSKTVWSKDSENKPDVDDNLDKL